VNQCCWSTLQLASIWAPTLSTKSKTILVRRLKSTAATTPLITRVKTWLSRKMVAWLLMSQQSHRWHRTSFSFRRLQMLRTRDLSKSLLNLTSTSSLGASEKGSHSTPLVLKLSHAFFRRWIRRATALLTLTTSGGLSSTTGPRSLLKMLRKSKSNIQVVKARFTT